MEAPLAGTSIYPFGASANTEAETVLKLNARKIVNKDKKSIIPLTFLLILYTSLIRDNYII
jgi:hypothetical protein